MALTTAGLEPVTAALVLLFVSETMALTTAGLEPVTAGIPPVLPTLYEHYTAGGIKSGLNADTPNFFLNGKNITLYSGSMHYFRVPRKYWRDRLRKMRAAGLNAVDTLVLLYRVVALLKKSIILQLRAMEFT